MVKCIIRCLIIAFSMIPLVAFAQDPIGYASVVVTTHRDYIDPSDGLISLREAINNADPVFDTVRFDASLNGLIITLGDSNGDGIVNYGDDIDSYMPTYAPGEAHSLDINKNIKIHGNGTWNTMISGGTIWTDTNSNSRMDNGDAFVEGVRIFYIDGLGIRVELESMSMVRGNGAGSDGGAVYVEGAQAVALTIDSCNFQNDTARSGGALYLDYGNANVSIQNSVFDNNYATTNGGALGCVSESTIHNSVLQNNSSDVLGGAVWLISGPRCTIEDSTFTDNRATSDGGAIYNDGRIWGEKIVFSDNRSGGDGGAICTPAENRSSNINGAVFASNDATGNGGAFYNNGLCTMFNGVFSSNSAAVDGGGVYEGQYGRSWLTNVTFVQNDAAVGSSGAYCSNAESGRSTTITNFIMVDNTTTAATELSITGAGTVSLAYGLIEGVDASLTGSTIAGTGFSTTGGMLDGSGGIAATAVFVAPTDQDGADNTWLTSDDGLRPLMTGPAANVGNDNALVDVNRDGTPEKTIADAVRDANSPFHQGIAGISRIRGTVDLGAYELYEVPDPTGTASVVVTTRCDVVNPVDGEISLREAIANANATHDTITFDASINGLTILLGDSDGDGDVDGMDDIDGSGTTYNSGTGYYLDLNTKNITIQGNGTANTIISGGLTWTDANSDGAIDWNEKASLSGGISIFYIRDSSVELNAMTLKNSNSTFSSGGALNSYTSDLTINNCNFTANYADVNGGAIFNNNGTLYVNGCVFFGNQSGSSGGAVLTTNASSDFSNCSFEKNTSMFAGAAEYLSDSSGNIDNCIFTQNTAVNYGGALVINSSGVISNLSISGSTFTENAAGTTSEADTFGADGGAISCRPYTRTTIRDTLFRSNKAFDDGGAIHGTDSNSTLTMQNVVFQGNSSQDDDSDGSGDGGALYIEGQFTASIFQGIFYGNQAVNATGRGGGVHTENATIYLTNCSFSRNLAANGGGALASIGDVAYVWIDNTVMYADASNANENEVHVTATTDSVSFYYSRVQGYGNPAYVEPNWTLNVGASTTSIAADPYEDSLDGNGDDNTWRTADDGLIIADASLVNAGRSSSQVDTDYNGIPETALDTLTADTLFGKDITGLKTRIQQISIGVGAYEVSPDPTGTSALIMTSTNDRIDPHDGVITLREAIANTAPGETITFDASMDGQVILLGDSDGDGDVDADDDIDGIGATYSAGTPAAIQIDNLTITGNGPENTIISGGMTWTDINGDNRLNAGDTYANGTGIFTFTGTNTVNDLTLMRGHAASGGAVSSITGTVFFNNCTFTENKASDGGAADGNTNSDFTFDSCLIQNNFAVNDGGALWSEGRITLENGTVLSENSAGNDGGAVNMGLSVNSHLEIDKVNFISNTAGNFGGAINSDAPMWITNIYFAQNMGTAKAGALNAANRCLATNCVFAENSTLGSGGAIADNNGSSRYTNNTFYNNAAGGAGFGGAIFHNGSALQIYNSVLWGNSAGTGKEIYTFNGSVTVGTSLVEGADSDLSGSTVQTSSGSFVDAGGNIDLATAAADPFLDKADVDGADDTPRTADDGLNLAFNYGIVDGGSSNAMVDIDENGVVDSTLASLNGAHATYGFDITGVRNRIAGNTADIGAYEYALTAEAPSTVVTTINDTVNVYDQVVSLREAITVYASTGDTVTFDASMNGQDIVLSSGQIVVDIDLTITGNGRTNTTISGGMVWTEGVVDGRLNTPDGYSGGSRIFNIDDSSGAQIDVTISGIAFTRANGTNGGAFYVANETLTLTDCLFMENRTTGSGASVYSLGAELTVSGTVFENNFSTLGAGIFNSAGDTVLRNSTFSRNTTTTAAALYNGSGNIEVTGVTFTENESVQGAALVNANGDCVVNNCTFSGNTASNNGIIYNVGTTTLANCTISYNSHGLHNTTGTLLLVNSIAWGNSTEISGSVVARYSIIEGGHAGTNIVNADPVLGALADNGGATQTRSLGDGSSAIGAGVMVYRDNNETIFYEDPNNADSYKRASDNSAYSPTSTDDCLSSTDQRGFSRLMAGRTDIGAYERDSITITFGISTTPSGTGGTLVGSTTQILDYMLNCTSVTAIANTGYHFVNWTTRGSEVLTAPIITINNVTTDTAYTANFAINTYAITTSVTGNGIISPEVRTVNHGANQTFTITAASDYELTNVLIDGQPIGAVGQFTFVDVSGSHSISAVFSIISGPDQPVLLQPEDEMSDVGLMPGLAVGYTATAEPATHLMTEWQIASDAEFSTMVFNLTSETFLTELTVPDMVLQPAATYYWRVRFVDTDGYEGGWSETGSFTTLADTIVDANGNLIPDDMEISPTSDLDGNGEADISQSGMHCISLPDAAGEICISVQDGTGTLEALSIIDPATIEDMDDRPIEMPLGLFSFRLRVAEPEAAAKVTIWFSQPLPENTVWYKYDTIDGWQDFSDDATLDEGMTSVTLSLIDGGFGDADGVANGIIVDPSGPVFTAIPAYTVTFTPESHGSIIGDSHQTILEGNDSTAVAAVPNPGCRFVNWTRADGSVFSTETTITVGQVSENMTLTAHFQPTTHEITTSVTGGGSISPQTATVNHSGDQTFAITPEPDYRIVDVLVDGVSVGTVDSYTFTNVAAAHSVSATFAMIIGPDLLSPSSGETDVIPTPELIVEYMETADPETHLLSEWQIASDPDFSEWVFSLTSETHLTELTVPDMVLQPAATYYWRVRFVDTEGYEGGWSETGSFTTAASSIADTDGNLIPDDMEISPTSDLDGNGEADISQVGMHCITLPDAAGEICISVQDGTVTLEALSIIDPATIEDMDDRPIEMPLGLFSFRLRVAAPEAAAQVTIWFSQPLPENTVWYKYDTIDGWQDFSDYAIFNEALTSVTLFLIDGWFGDADGCANRIVVDPSGPVYAMPEAESDNENSGGGGCFIKTIWP